MYPKGRRSSDFFRLCAHMDEKSGAVCGKPYKQWSGCQNDEPWSKCPDHALRNRRDLWEFDEDGNPIDRSEE